MPNGRWTRLLLPLDDFGIYAVNEGTNILRSFEPPRSTNLLLLAFFSPYRQLKAETRIVLDEISLVRVGVPREHLLSFWQNPTLTNAQLVSLTNYSSYYGHRRQNERILR